MMVDLTGYISYRQAKLVLENRLQTSEEEIALWVSGIAGDEFSGACNGTK
jgi:hypothetical protein